MPGFLGSLFTKAAPQTEADSIARATGGSASAPGYGFGLGPVGKWDIDYAVKNGLEKVTMVFRCVDVIASNQSRLPIRLRDSNDTRKGQFLENQSLWNLLNVQTNSYEKAWQFRYRLSAVALLSRRGAFIEVKKNRYGTPVALHILPPGVTEPIPDAETFVSGYRVQRSDWQIDTLDPDQVIWVKIKPHPTDPYAQMTPLMAAGIAAETDWLAHMFNRTYLAADGRPGTLITVGRINPTDAAEIKRRFMGGPLRAGEAMVIEGADLDVKDMGASPHDAQWDALLKMSDEEIRLAFGVPESVMGNASGRTFANADAEKEIFWQETEVPHCDALAQGLDELTGSRTDNQVLAFDYSGIDVLQRAEIRKREEARNEVEAGLRTIDSYFELLGEEAWDVPATRALWNRFGVPIGRTPADQKVLEDLKPITMPEPGAAPGLPGVPAPINAGVADAVVLPRRADARSRALQITASLGSSRQIESKSDDKEGDIAGYEPDPHAEHRARLEASIEGIFTALDAQQKQVIPDRLVHVKSRKGTRHWEGEEKAAGDYIDPLDPNYSVETDRWVADIERTMRSVIRRAVRREMNQAARQMDKDGALTRFQRIDKGRPLERLFGGQMYAEAVMAKIEDRAMNIVTGAVRRQAERVKRKINDADLSGMSMTAIQKEVRKLIGGRTSWRKYLSANISTQVIEGAKDAVFGELDGLYVKVWHSHHDERTRPTHTMANGQIRNGKESFFVGGSYLRFPGDPLGPASETINCRCWVTRVPTVTSEV